MRFRYSSAVFKSLIVAVITLSLASGTAFAQATASSVLQGTVMDKSGAVIPGASVKATNNATGLTREMVTSGAGAYRFDLLPTGTYEVRVTSKGFAVMAFKNVELTVGQTATIDAKLEPSQQAEIITVEGSGAPIIDVTKTDVSLPITTQQVQDLPLNGRDFVNLAFLAPGAKPVDSYDPTKNRVGVFAVNGSSGRNVNVTVNGIDNKDNTVGGPVMQLPLEAIQEFNISTQRFSAANGRSEGAAINVITKSGSNELHGSAYGFFRNEALNTKNALEETKSPYSRQQFGGSIGGPVKKDKLFFFFALEREREHTNITVNPTALTQLNLIKNLGAQPSSTIPTPYFDWRYNGRVDYRLNDKHNLSFSYSNQNNSGQNDQSGSQNDLSEGNFTKNQLIVANASLNSVLSPSVVNVLTFGYQYWDNLIDSTIRAPYLTFPGGASIGTNPNVPQQSYQAKWQFKDDIAITKGRHTFKTGFDYLWEPKLGGFFEYTATPEIDFLADPSEILSNTVKYPQGFGTPGLVSGIAMTNGDPYFFLSAKMFGLYFQDDWRVSRRLTLNLGARWDRDFNLTGGQSQLKSRTYLQLKGINSPYAGVPSDDTKDFSPRIGFAYDLTGSGRHVLRGGFGLYYGQIFENIPLFMLQQTNPTLFSTVLSLTSGGAGDPNADAVPGQGKLLSAWRYGVDPLPGLPPPVTNFVGGEVGRLLDPDYHNPYTEQANIGYSFELNPSNSIEIEYVHTLSLRESKTIDINPKDPNNGGNRTLNATFAAKGLPQLARIDNEMSIGRSRYDGFNVSYRRRMSRHISVNASYVLSRAIAYAGAGASFRNRPTDINNWFAAHDLGPTPSDERHRAVFSGIFDLPWGIKVSPFIQLASARPYNSQQGVDVFGYGRPIAQAILLKSDPANYLATVNYTAAQARTCLTSGNCIEAPYDSLRGQPFFQFDARFGKTLRFKERYTVDMFFQAFDLTNRANYGGNYSGNIQSAQFRTPIGFITPNGVIVPRSFSGELGVQFRF
jgi:hypothetical protein